MRSFNLELLPSLQGRALQTAIMLTSAMAFLLYGYDQGVLGGLLTTPEFLGGVKLSPTDSSLLGTVVAIYDIGCFVGSTLCAVSASKLGRRVWIGLGAVLIIIGAGLQGGAHNPGTMIAGRIIGGIGMGIQTAMIRVWVAECCQPQVRGTLVTGQLSIVIFGAVVAYWVDYGTIIHLQGQLVWRFPLSFQAAFCLLCLIGLPFLPESPRYLYSRGHNDDADQIIGRIYSVPQNHATVEKIRSDTLRALEYEKEATIRLKDVFWDRSNLNIAWRIWPGIIIMVLQQLGGPNLIGYYATLLYTHSLGMSEHQAALTSGGTFLVMWGGTLACVLFIERVGRRKLMIIGAISQLIAMALFTTGLGVGTTASQRLSIVCIFLYNFAFGASWCSIPFIYIPEILPLHGRAFGMALAVGVEWLMTFIIVKIGPIGITNVGWKFYLLFVVGLTLQCFFSVLFIKETKGLPLEDIDALFQKKSAPPMEKEYPSIPMKTSGLEEVEVV